MIVIKSEITISELAKLMNVSVHQIRYFEEKGVLQPAYTDTNQYRMYGMDQIYELARILLLRKFEVPVQSIKGCTTSYSEEQHRQLLHHSLQNIEAELVRLEELRLFILKVLHEQQSYRLQPDQFSIKNRELTFLSPFIQLDSNTRLHAALLAGQANHIPNLLESDIHYLYDGSSTVTLYLETQAPGEISLPQGECLTLQCLIQEEELEYWIEHFFDYAVTQSILLTGPLVVIERSYLSLFSPNKLLQYELQALIAADANPEGGESGIRTEPITIEPMQARYNRQVGRLLAQAFHGKFQMLTNMNEGDLALFFEKLLEYVPTEPSTQRVVALQQGEVIGSIAMKWKPRNDAKKNKQQLPPWEIFSRFGRWNLINMRIALYVLDHKPEFGGCYIADLVVRSDQRSKGVGRILLQWAQHVVDLDPDLDRLSLHVSGSNPRAKQLYGRLSFQTHSCENRWILHLLFNESRWDYMVQRREGI